MNGFFSAFIRSGWFAAVCAVIGVLLSLFAPKISRGSRALTLAIRIGAAVIAVFGFFFLAFPGGI